MPPKLKIDYASHVSAKYACENWHYSKRIPVNKLVRFGVWEDDQFVGVILFGVGASATMHLQYQINSWEVCELVRVALKHHEHTVTKMVSICIRLLKKGNPGLRLIASFADPSVGHHGGIYQGGNWIYTGISSAVNEYWFNGSWRHATDVYKRLNKNAVRALQKRKKPGKHRYVFPLDEEMRQRVLPLAKPFIKRTK